MAMRRQGQALAIGLVMLTGGAACGTGQPRPAVPHVSGVDYSTDEAANFQAAQLAMRLERVLPPFPGYAGLRIVSYGIEVDVVGEPPPAVRSAVARYGLRYQGREIPVRFRSVRNPDSQLQALVRQISADHDEWVAKGIEPTAWGVDIESNTVEIRLARYLPGYGQALIARYGDRVTVYPHDFPVAGD